MNLKFVRELVETLSTQELEERVHAIEASYFKEPIDRQKHLLDMIGDYLKALDVRLQMERQGVDETTALRNLAHRMRVLNANRPYSEWLDQRERIAERA